VLPRKYDVTLSHMEIIGVKTKGLHSCWAGGRLHRYSAKFQFHTFIGSRDNAF